MTATEIIDAAFFDGVQISLSEDGKVLCTGEKSAIAEWTPILREHKAGILSELRRKNRHSKVLTLLSGRQYAVLVEDAKTNPVICTVAIRGLATFDLAIPHKFYDGMALLELVEKHSVGADTEVNNIK